MRFIRHDATFNFLYNIQKYFSLVTSTLHLTLRKQLDLINGNRAMPKFNCPGNIARQQRLSLARMQTQMDHEAKHVER